jgi:iduronate 2-sulfatase
VVWKDRRNPDDNPLYIELYDHETDPAETTNIADEEPSLVTELLTRFDAGWKGSLASSSRQRCQVRR